MQQASLDPRGNPVLPEVLEVPVLGVLPVPQDQSVPLDQLVKLEQQVGQVLLESLVKLEHPVLRDPPDQPVLPVCLDHPVSLV